LNRLSLVLAIEPDLRQAAIVKRIVKERVLAEVVVVDSRDAAIAAIRTAIPDVILVSALLSPRDEADLIGHLRTLEGAAHLQTHTIPQLASTLDGDEDGGGLFSSFRRKKRPEPGFGCDPDVFADEVRGYLKHATERKREAAESGKPSQLPAIARKTEKEKEPAPAKPVEATPASAWESPFEWRPASERRATTAAPQPPVVQVKVQPPPAIPDLASLVDPEPPMPDLSTFAAEAGSEAPVTGSQISDSGSQIGGAESAISEPPPPRVVVAAPPRPPKIHKPAPFSVWARKESRGEDAAKSKSEVHDLLARLGVPESVASAPYVEGVRIRRVRVRVAAESHSALQGAVMLSKRVLAELRGSDASA